MRRHSAETVTAALRDLDPAPSTELTQAELDRADAAFARIVATTYDEPVSEVRGRQHRSRSRLLVAAGLVGAVGVITPVMLLGGSSAYGSWTPTPVPLIDVVANRAAITCRAALDVPDRGERVAVAERRGGWTYVLLVGPRTEAICLMPDGLVGQNPTDRREFFGSYDMDPAGPPTLDSDRIDEMTNMQGNTDEGWFLWVGGYVGSDVTGVTVHTSSGLEIETSVSGNRFAAWWPSSKQSSDHPAETWSYTVHLADGTTRRTS